MGCYEISLGDTIGVGTAGSESGAQLVTNILPDSPAAEAGSISTEDADAQPVVNTRNVAS